MSLPWRGLVLLGFSLDAIQDADERVYIDLILAPLLPYSRDPFELILDRPVTENRVGNLGRLISADETGVLLIAALKESMLDQVVYGVAYFFVYAMI